MTGKLARRLGLFAAAFAVFAVLATASAVTAVSSGADAPRFKALVFSKTAAFRHASIPTAVAAVQKLGAEHNFAVDATEDATAFNDVNLAQYDVVIFLMTTGDVLNDTQQGAFAAWSARTSATTRVSPASTSSSRRRP
jgi:cytochrome c